MTKGSKSGAVSVASKGKAVTEKKGKRSQFHTRVDMNFNTKITKLHRQDEVDEYLEKYSVQLSPEIQGRILPLGYRVRSSSS